MLRGYGMSELSPVSHLIPTGSQAIARRDEPPLSSIGWAVPQHREQAHRPVPGDEIPVPEGV